MAKALQVFLWHPRLSKLACALRLFLNEPWETLAVVVSFGNIGPLPLKGKEGSSPIHCRRELEHSVRMQTFSFVSLQGGTPAFDTPLLQAAADVTDKAVELLQASKAAVGEQDHFSLNPGILPHLLADTSCSIGLASWSPSFFGGASQHQSSNPGVYLHWAFLRTRIAIFLFKFCAACPLRLHLLSLSAPPGPPLLQLSLSLAVLL